MVPGKTPNSEVSYASPSMISRAQAAGCAGKGKIRLEKHKHYVQGVAWDPLSAFLMTLSADRTCKYVCPLPCGLRPAAAAQGLL